MSIFQLLALIFATFMIYVVRVKAKKYKLSRLETFGWYFIWICFAVTALFPNILLGVVGILHFSRVFDLLTVIALMIITAIVSYLYFQIKELQIKLEHDVRQEALSKGKQKRE